MEFRSIRLLDEHGQSYTLGIATGQAMLREVERDQALSARLVAQSPIGLAVLDTGLRYVMVNPALERLNDLSAAQHIGRDVHEVVPFLDDPGAAAPMMRQVLDTGRPLVNQFVLGRSPTVPAADIARSVSYYRLEDPAGRVLGCGGVGGGVTEQYRAGLETTDARKRLSTIARASVMVGATLDMEQTARELADILVPELADLAAVGILDAVLDDRQPGSASLGASALFRALAVTAVCPAGAVHAPDPTGHIAAYDADRLITRCATTGRPVLNGQSKPPVTTSWVHCVIRTTATTSPFSSPAHTPTGRDHWCIPPPPRGRAVRSH
ncbi:PAS domain-containing protein [Streptomyces sp. NPDC088246]|uniref:PAS domain-containing protein n=1 Tax=Streptomyces sp. NPDC088246 TaxID=3365842 RepID=UPI0038018D11